MNQILIRLKKTDPLFVQKTRLRQFFIFCLHLGIAFRLDQSRVGSESKVRCVKLRINPKQWEKEQKFEITFHDFNMLSRISSIPAVTSTMFKLIMLFWSCRLHAVY